MRQTALFWLLASLIVCSGDFLAAANFEVSQEEDGVTVKLDGKLLTRYVVKSGSKPILWPLIGPTGDEITRQYPMRKALPSEKSDHVHHRSFWFTHGDVNGISFWHEDPGKTGDIVHREFVKVSGGQQAQIITRNDWIGPKKKRHCEDIRTLTFGVDNGNVWIDFDTTVTASDGDATFGDTKEGCFGVRVAGTMKITSKLGGKIINSEGHTDAGAWGKAAAWCDYHGPVNGKHVGVAILNHPQSLRYPTHWHVRTYGLFTANPFGLSYFEKKPRGTGDLVLKKGESFSLFYRVLLHKGDEKEGGVKAAFEKYAEMKKE